MDLEDDLEIIEDKIQQYLLAKFEELKLQCEALQDELDDNQQELSESTLHDGNSLQISGIWTRTLSNKCVLGFEVNSPESLKNVNLILTIDDKPHLSYTIKVFELFNENAKDSRYCRKDCQLISRSIYTFNERNCDNAKHVFVTASFDFLPFLHEHVHVIVGTIQCGTQTQKVISCPFPRVEFSVDQAINQSLCYETNLMETLLASVSCYNAREWTLKANEYPPIIDYRSALQSHCPLTYVPFKSGGYFLSDKTPLFGHLSIVVLNVSTFEDHSILNFKIFAEKRRQYVLLTHCILQFLKNITDENRPGAGKYELIQREHETPGTLDDFITELKVECDNLSGFFENNALNARLLLNDIESKSDSTYAQS